MKLAEHVNKLLAVKTPEFSKLLLIRSGESLANAAGMLCGWMDPKLTQEGNNQAEDLSEVIYPQRRAFKTIGTSDLQRCLKFADRTLNYDGIIGERLLRMDPRLREINFGDQDWVNYDLLSDKDKEEINSFKYKAPNGESWADVNSRFKAYLNELDQSESHCVFTHGGTIRSLTYHMGIEEYIPPASVVGVLYSKKEPANSKVLFYWVYDYNEIL